MLTYKYEARNPKTGEKVKANVQADSEQAAAKLIHEQGLSPIDIKVESGGRSFGIKKRVGIKDKVLFSRQLSTLINAGLPLVQSLRSVGGQTENKAFQVVITEIVTDVEAGAAFSKALEKHPKMFNKVFVSLVAASETSGTLDTGLVRLADQQEKDADIISKVRGAMMYPICVFLVMIAVLVFMLVKVLPQVKSIYDGIPGASLPFITQALLALSGFLTNQWWLALIIVALITFFLTRWARTEGGRSVIDLYKLRGWPVNGLFMKMYMARFASTAHALVGSGVPLIQVMEITSDAVGNVHIAASLRKAIEKVKGGKALSESIDNDPNFLELVPNMLRIGEQSGAMETMLEKVSDYYQKEVDDEIKAVSTIIEPVMMVIMGVMALIIVAAILLPIYGLTNQSGFSGS